MKLNSTQTWRSLVLDVIGGLTVVCGSLFGLAQMMLALGVENRPGAIMELYQGPPPPLPPHVSLSTDQIGVNTDGRSKSPPQGVQGALANSIYLRPNEFNPGFPKF